MGRAQTLYAGRQGNHDPKRPRRPAHEVALVCEEITNEPRRPSLYEAILDLDSAHRHAMRAEICTRRKTLRALAGSSSTGSLPRPQQNVALKSAWSDT